MQNKQVLVSVSLDSAVSYAAMSKASSHAEMKGTYPVQGYDADYYLTQYLEKMTQHAKKVFVYSESNGSSSQAFEALCKARCSASQAWYHRIKERGLNQLCAQEAPTYLKGGLTSKRSMLLAQMWDAYHAKEPEITHVEHHFMHDKQAITDDVLINLNPHDMPPNTTLFIMHFDDRRVAKKIRSGLVDISSLFSTSQIKSKAKEQLDMAGIVAQFFQDSKPYFSLGTAMAFASFMVATVAGKPREAASQIALVAGGLTMFSSWRFINQFHEAPAEDDPAFTL